LVSFGQKRFGHFTTRNAEGMNELNRRKSCLLSSLPFSERTSMFYLALFSRFDYTVDGNDGQALPIYHWSCPFFSPEQFPGTGAEQLAACWRILPPGLRPRSNERSTE
jgi:hypothetical protein